MLGHRGCRLAISYPEIYETQARAIAEAAVISHGAGVDVELEIMVPFVSASAEIRIIREQVVKVVDSVFSEAEVDLGYTVGTMIELPRACLIGGEIAEHADFFSFGTNDLTQMGCGFSRDDAGRFLGDHVSQGVYDYDPFQVLDADGIGRLVETAVKLGKQTRRNIKLGICGEHGGDPKSVHFCHKVGLNYVSCSPFRVPIARLAAAQAALSK